MPPLKKSSSTGLTITNPLILYRALLATRQIDPDPAQHRLALHLQKLYFRLKDYSPQADYSSRLKAISKSVQPQTEKEDEGSVVAVSEHPLRRNPLFAHIFRDRGSTDKLALTKLLTSHDAAMNLDSPRGLLLYGEVGTGKSMLVDLLADSLPNRKKRRWHFNTFMLETLSNLESLRRSHLLSRNTDTEYSLLWLAKDMIEKSPILFLDEFQLPDRAASKILSNLLTMFFQLGGVLIASSNRMPDELAKASGVEFAPPPSTGLVRNWLGLGAGRGKGDIFAGSSEFSSFLDVLKARCEVWDMQGSKDWRRSEAEAKTLGEDMQNSRYETIEEFAELGGKAHEMLAHKYAQDFQDSGTVILKDALEAGEKGEMAAKMNAIAPRKYVVPGIDSEETWQNMVLAAFPHGTPSLIPWEPRTLHIYGRDVRVPHQYNGITLWTFLELCGSTFGPADYITLASTFHTVILTDVPILTLAQKNEARRLITLLDALYESRCKLVIRAATGPDTLFFPETSHPTTTTVESNETDVIKTLDADAVYPETLSEIYQDQTSPFRPNVSSYTPTQADEDSDFGPIHPTGHAFARQPLDFAHTGAFTGEDERFAYKRARSRLWEMCGARWHARQAPGWWRPLPLEVRRWERQASRVGTASTSFDPFERNSRDDVKLGGSVDLNTMAGLQGREADGSEKMKSPFRENREPPPKIGGWHAWGMAEWGQKAGAWGRGVDELQERAKKLEKVKSGREDG